MKGVDSFLLVLAITKLHSNHMPKNKLPTSLIAGGMAAVGLLAGIATIASAQSAATITTTPVPVSSSANASTTATIDKPETANDPVDTDTGSKAERHAPLGGDGVVSSITGSTIIVSEESDEGGVSYTVDASKATITNGGAAATLADIKVGAKIFVQGAVTGNAVAATSISLDHPHERMDKGNDTDGGAASEANEPAGSADVSDN